MRRATDPKEGRGPIDLFAKVASRGVAGENAMDSATLERRDIIGSPPWGLSFANPSLVVRPRNVRYSFRSCSWTNGDCGADGPKSPGKTPKAGERTSGLTTLGNLGFIW